jgi:hypothetical protein
MAIVEAKTGVSAGSHGSHGLDFLLQLGFDGLETAEGDLNIGTAYRAIALAYMLGGDMSHAEEYARRAIGYHHEATRGAPNAESESVARSQHGMSVKLAGQLAVCRADELAKQIPAASPQLALELDERRTAERGVASRLFAIAQGT